MPQHTSRRQFIQTSLVASAALAGLARGARAAEPDDTPEPLTQPPPPKAAVPLKVLILGGTGFLGPHATRAALDRGHKVTLFNRGLTESRRKRAGRPSAVPEGVEVLFGNRDPEKTADADARPDEPRDPESPKGLSQLEGREWDAVIDTSGYFPRIVKASAALLAPKVKHYLFISTLSVYADNSTPNDESGAIATMPDAKTEEFGDQFQFYGPAKALCEQAAQAAMPGKVANLRPGFIVGPRDTSRRFIYWPLRASQGGEMIVPGTPDDPIQVVDVRDLADFMIRCLESNFVGVCNVTGPKGGMRMQDFVQGVIKGVESDAKPVWIDDAFLRSQDVDPQRFPLWIKPEGEGAGFHRCIIDKALAAGLTFRPISDTARAMKVWYTPMQTTLLQAISPPLLEADQEAAILKAFREKK
jgi:2'-hydroxyisoflavone reductase